MNLGKIIGTGNTATIYEWEEGRVLKLFKEDYPCDAVSKEYSNSVSLNDLKFAKPRAHGTISLDEKMGIIYDRIDGEALLDWLLRTNDAEGCAKIMAKLHRDILRNNISNVPDYREGLRSHLKRANYEASKKEEILNKIDSLPEGDKLCHGDFHPGNIIISDGVPTVIDFMNVCKGTKLYDIARTVFLLQYTPGPPQFENNKEFMEFRRALAELYLREMECTRDMIGDYLSIIIAARKGECPEE